MFCTTSSMDILLAAAILCILVLLFSFSVIPRPTLSLPPGPKGNFISGNIHQLPKTEGWISYAKWGVQYGPVVYFRIFTRNFVVLNTVEAITNLLDRRAAIYSDRPQTWMFHKLCNRELTALSISSLHPWHKIYKKMLQTGLNARATESYWPLLQSEIYTLLHGLRKSPERLEDHLRRNATAVIMRVAFGYTIKDDNDDFLAAAEETSKITGWAMAPGRWLADSFPILRFIPAWMPGAGFRRQAMVWGKQLDYLSRVPHEWVKTQIASGDYVESFTSSLLCPPDGSKPDAEEEEVIKFCAGGLYAGAADTTVSCLVSFMMLMALHPAVQTRAQEEIDRILNPGELASHSRLEHLVYLQAILKEVLRFAPVGPLSLPHKLIIDDEYDSFRIPKNTTVIPNVWAVMHDERYYPKPFEFNPDRFLSSSNNSKIQLQPDPKKYSFGFGARLCPAVHFAEKSMLLTMSSILANFSIEMSPEVSVDIANLECTTGHTSHIQSFKCNIIPRK